MQMLHSSRNSYALMALVLLVAGCAAFTQPKTFEEQLAYAYGTHTAVLLAAASSVTAGTLSPGDGEVVLAMADQSRAVLDLAKLTATTGDTTNAEGQLALATNILTELQKYLNMRIKK